MNIKPKFLFWLSLSIVLVVTLIPTDGKVAGNYLDKLVHFLIFAFLAFQVERSFQASSFHTLLLLGCVLLGFLTEYLQQFIPGRNMDIYDAFADTLGVFLAHLFYLKK